MLKPPLFKCPYCAAGYYVIEIEVEPSVDVAISCLTCDQPLPSRDGKYALKYFLAGGQGRPRTTGAIATPRRSSRSDRSTAILRAAGNA
jgi:hypothetical protein